MEKKNTGNRRTYLPSRVSRNAQHESARTDTDGTEALVASAETDCPLSRANDEW